MAGRVRQASVLSLGLFSELARDSRRLTLESGSPRTLEAYARGRRLVDLEHVVDGKFEPAIEKLMSRSEVDYLQVNSTTAGCFTFRIERASAPGETPIENK
jgi:hypothetical protein